MIRIPQSSNITGTSPSDCLVPYSGHPLGGGYPPAEVQSVYSIAPADWAIVKQSLTGLNPEFSFSYTSFHAKVKEPSLPYYFTHSWMENSWIHFFPRVLLLCEMQTASSMIWTQVSNSVFYDSNLYTMTASAGVCDNMTTFAPECLYIDELIYKHVYMSMHAYKCGMYVWDTHFFLVLK